MQHAVQFTLVISVSVIFLRYSLFTENVINLIYLCTMCCRVFNFINPFLLGVGKMWNCGMRNAEGKMWNRKCGTTLIGRSSEPRDRCLSAYYRNDI